MKEFKEFDDCLYCGKHTKNLWSILCIQKHDGEPIIAGGLSDDSSKIFPDRMGVKALNFIPTAGERLDDYGVDISNYSEILLLQVCENCKKLNIRETKSEKLIYPRKPDIDSPNKDMPGHIKEIYKEASLIYNDSLRAALALLRLGVELLCDEVGYSNGNLYNRIERLAEDGVIDDEIKDIAHGVRGLGNNAIHPKQIDETATEEEVKIVFDLLNMITEELITKPRRKREFAIKYRK